MNATIRFLTITAAIVIPWAVIRIAGWESRIVTLLKPLQLSDLAILGLLVIPPLALLVIRWLFEPQGKSSKRNSGNKNTLIRFRG